MKNENFVFNNKIDSKPIFIVGMPRSGTSLLEQILSTHSKIYGAGELNFLQKIIDKLGFEDQTNLKSYFSEVRKYYYEEITKISNANFIIDKLPSNFRWIGFIVKAFPEAKNIYLVSGCPHMMSVSKKGVSAIEYIASKKRVTPIMKVAESGETPKISATRSLIAPINYSNIFLFTKKIFLLDHLL